MSGYRLLLSTSALSLFSCLTAAEILHAGLFSQSGLKGWEEHSFHNNTIYTMHDLDGKQIVKATSDAAASGLFLSRKVDLSKTPYLNWRWRVDKTLENINEQSKEGDDYPARIYVVKEGLFPWNTKAVNYVWSSNQPIDTSWPNAYTSNARMIAVQSGDERSGEWLEQKRNVMDDFKQLFGDEIDEITTIAIMTDTDNSGQQTTAYYGDIYFSSE